MTTIHPTSCTECEALKINDCPQCDMYKWRVVQNSLAGIIAIETITALSFGTYFAILLASQENIQTILAVNHFGGAEYLATIGGSIVFIGCVLMFALRDIITDNLMKWAEVLKQSREEEEDEDDE